MKKKNHMTFIDHLPEANPDDFKFDFQTPVPVAKYMVSLLPEWVVNVCEPTPGAGNIERALKNRSATEVTAPEDYFLMDKHRSFDAFVMNPPFSKKFTNTKNAPDSINEKGMRMGYWFLTDAMKRASIVIALMPWFTISDSDVRLRMLMRYGLKSLTALPRKTFQFARIQTVIIELEKGYKGETVFRAFDCLHDHKQPKIFDHAH